MKKTRHQSLLNAVLRTLALFSLAVFLPPPAAGFADENRMTNDIGMTFIKVNPGTFMMGSPLTERLRDKDERQHEVTIKSAFYLQETEVTVKQWRAVMGAKFFARRNCSENMPVTRVSWYNCMKFIKKLSRKTGQTYRLPTEAEWEYACRAGSTTAYSWGSGIDCSKAMYGNNAKKDNECTLFYQTLQLKPGGPAPVKTFAPNAWGFYDMHGNVWEWCADPYGEYSEEPVPDTNFIVESAAHVRRGGSWFKHAQYLRSANRTYAHPGAKFKTTGFRLVLEAD